MNEPTAIIDLSSRRSKKEPKNLKLLKRLLAAQTTEPNKGSLPAEEER